MLGGNRDLRVSGVLLCLYETGTRLAADVTDDLLLLESSDEDAWAGAHCLREPHSPQHQTCRGTSFGQIDLRCAPASAGARLRHAGG
ncbi:MAG: hypothetical protein R3C02_23210 [Planctomycetaceae bacterium]